MAVWLRAVRSSSSARSRRSPNLLRSSASAGASRPNCNALRPVRTWASVELSVRSEQSLSESDRVAPTTGIVHRHDDVAEHTGLLRFCSYRRRLALRVHRGDPGTSLRLCCSRRRARTCLCGGSRHLNRRRSGAGFESTTTGRTDRAARLATRGPEMGAGALRDRRYATGIRVLGDPWPQMPTRLRSARALVRRRQDHPAGPATHRSVRLDDTDARQPPGG